MQWPSVPGTARPLTPLDFEVDSIARECEDLGRGNGCETDPDDLGITCYSMCTDDLCNKGIPKPKEYSPQQRPAKKEEDYVDDEVNNREGNELPDLPDNYQDYDPKRPDTEAPFPKPLMNDTEVDVHEHEAPTPNMEEPDTKQGQGRPRGGMRPDYNDVEGYEGQDSENSASALCQHYVLVAIASLSIFFK